MANELFFSAEAKWDLPFFKRLAANDTGSAPGHQGGMVIPKNLREFFPILIGEVTSVSPTVDHNIKAILLIDGRLITTVITRYQIQSWGATRDFESRLTGNLGPLRNSAHKDDYLIIQRSLEDLDLYRLNLITKENPFYKKLEKIQGSARWGLVEKEPPMTQDDIVLSVKEEKKRELSPFNLFDQEVKINETRGKRIARSIIFRITVQRIYRQTCAICGTSLKSPQGPIEIDAAHIVPRTQLGTDDARNGLALCKRHHWAFDHGLFSVDDSRKILIPASVRKISQNSVLFDLHGNPLREADDSNMLADAKALKWHRDNILIA